MAARRLATSLLAALVGMPLSACASGHEAKTIVIPRAVQVDEPPAAEETPLAEVAERTPGERDPFVSPFDQGALVPKPVGGTPLTEQELDAFRLVGVVVGTSTPMALFEDAQGRGYRAKIGELMGRRGGQVTTIAPGRVVVSERLYDAILGARHFERVFEIVRPAL